MTTDFFVRFMDKTRNAIDNDPVLRLAVSLDSFHGSGDDRMAGLDHVEDYVREVDVSQLSGTLRDDVLKFRGAQDILSGRTFVGGVEYSNLAINVVDASGSSISELVPDTQARGIISRIMTANPELNAQLARRGPEVPF